MKLRTTRLTINPVEKEDIERIHKLHSIKELTKFSTLGIPIDLSVTEKLLQNVLSESHNMEFDWTIWIKENRFIGELGMGISQEMNYGEIHFSLLPDAWGNGFAVEAVKRVIKFGFENLHLQRVEANTATGNIHSIKVLEGAGMTKESIQPKTLLIDDNWLDNYTFSILATTHSSK